MYDLLPRTGLSNSVFAIVRTKADSNVRPAGEMPVPERVTSCRRLKSRVHDAFPCARARARRTGLCPIKPPTANTVHAQGKHNVTGRRVRSSAAAAADRARRSPGDRGDARPKNVFYTHAHERVTCLNT